MFSEENGRFGKFSKNNQFLIKQIKLHLSNMYSTVKYVSVFEICKKVLYHSEDVVECSDKGVHFLQILNTFFNYSVY